MSTHFQLLLGIWDIYWKPESWYILSIQFYFYQKHLDSRTLQTLLFMSSFYFSNETFNIEKFSILNFGYQIIISSNPLQNIDLDSFDQTRASHRIFWFIIAIPHYVFNYSRKFNFYLVPRISRENLFLLNFRFLFKFGKTFL